MRYEATSDQDTIINITNHSYFNLNGHASSVHNHVLKLNADEVVALMVMDYIQVNY